MRTPPAHFARSRRYLKRGRDAYRVSLHECLYVTHDPPVKLLVLDDALNALADVDRRKSQVEALRFFGGLSVEEAAEALGVSNETVKRDGRLAKLWLLRELSAEKRDGP